MLRTHISLQKKSLDLIWLITYGHHCCPGWLKLKVKFLCLCCVGWVAPRSLLADMLTRSPRPPTESPWGLPRSPRLPCSSSPSWPSCRRWPSSGRKMSCPRSSSNMVSRRCKLMIVTSHRFLGNWFISSRYHIFFPIRERISTDCESYLPEVCVLLHRKKWMV